MKESGEEARLASHDYRAVHSNQTKPAQNGGSPGHVAALRKEEKTTSSFPKFSALKKPAPLPPVLRRLVKKKLFTDFITTDFAFGI